MWSSIGAKPYIIYFIYHQWNLKNRCLQTQFLPEDHTAEILSQAIEATLEAWNLTAMEQVYLTTDNSSNILKAARDLGWVQLSCFGHNLYLAITKSLNRDDRCSRALDMCHKVVSVFSMSWKWKIAYLCFVGLSNQVGFNGQNGFKTYRSNRDN